MATIKSYTDISQSKKLTNILPLESADMMYHSIESEYGSGAFVATSKVITNGLENDEFYIDDIPCWSLAALISILPRFIEFNGDKYYLRFMKDYIEYANDEVSITGRCLHTTGNNNLVDASYEMVLKLHEHKMLNKC